MSPFQFLIAGCIVAWLSCRAIVIVHDGVVETRVRHAREGRHARFVLDGVLGTGGRLMMLGVSAVALGCCIEIARATMR